jgi:aminoglycoside phosphotransferase
LEGHGRPELARHLLDCLEHGGDAALAPLNVAFAGHAGTWQWSGGPVPLIVKHAATGDREARECLRREAAVLAALAPTGVVPTLACVLAERSGEVAGFAYERLPAERGVDCARPAAVAAFAEAITRLHACTWGLAPPPLGLDVPVALGGHPLWIGGSAILRRMCAAIEGGENRPLARCAREALDLLESRRAEITVCFPRQELVVTHGDIDAENLLFRREALAWRCRLIDFGEVVLGAPQYDLARFAVSAELAPAGEELLLALYALWLEERTAQAPRDGRLDARFRTAYSWQKLLALFDIRIASYVIYAAHGLDPGPREEVLERVEGALAILRTMLTAGSNRAALRPGGELPWSAATPGEIRS